MYGSSNKEMKSRMIPHLTIDKVDVIIIKRCAGEYGTVRVESGVGDRRRPVVVEEARVGLVSGQMTATHVERPDFMTIGAPVANFVNHLYNQK